MTPPLNGSARADPLVILAPPTPAGAKELGDGLFAAGDHRDVPRRSRVAGHLSDVD